MSALRRAGALALALLAVTACALSTERCGTPRPGGGPPIIETREQELCENVRLAALHYLDGLPELSSERAEEITHASRRWTGVDSLASLLARLERDVDADFAALVERYVRWSETRSELPPGESPDTDRALARAAGHGAHLAAGVAYQFVDLGAPVVEDASEPGPDSGADDPLRDLEDHE